MNNARTGCSAFLALLAMLLGPGACGRSPENPAMPPAPKTQPPGASHAVVLPAFRPAGAVRLDGTGGDEAWKHAAALPAFGLAKAYGCPPAAESRACVLRAGKWLIVGLAAAEGDGIVARQTICGAEMWRDDAFVVDLAPPRAAAAAPAGGAWRIYVNPLGAVSCYCGGRPSDQPLAARTVRAAARLRPDGWRVELALDLPALLGPQAPGSGPGLRILRQRQARGLVPFEESAAPAPDAPALTLPAAPAPGGADVQVDVAAPQQFAEPTVLTATVLDHPPATNAEWAALPPSTLKCEDGRALLGSTFQSTQVRAAFVPHPAAASPDFAPRDSRGAPHAPHAPPIPPPAPAGGGTTTTTTATANASASANAPAPADDLLCLSIRCNEVDPASIDARGEALWQEDSLEIFAGPAGFGYAQFVTNPTAVLESAVGRPGGRGIRPGKPPAGVTAEADRTQPGGWTVRLTIPLPAVAQYVGAPPDRLPPGHPWLVQVVRNRPARQALGQAAQTSLLSLTASGTTHCPARFATLRLVKAGDAAAAGTTTAPAGSAAVADLPPPILDADQARRLGAATLLQRWIDGRAAALHQRHEKAFVEVSDAAGWRKLAAQVRQDLAGAMFPATGGAMPPRGELDARIVYDLPRDGYRCAGVIFQSQPGLPVPVTLYVPAAGTAPPAGAGPVVAVKRPALIMVPAHHSGRNSHDLLVLGAAFARAGGVAMAMESIGSGERGVAEPWAHKNAQGYLFGVQVFLAGDNPAGWTAFDISRGIDYLLARGDVDAGRIAIVGGVAGGGDITAAAAALDERIAVSIPFNFSTAEPMEAWYDPLRSYWGADAGDFTAWFVCALAAPRRLVQAQEFAWTDAERGRFERFRKVYGWLGAADRVAILHGGPNTHATHFNTMHRLPLYAILNGWFDMRLPTRAEDEPAALPAANGLDCFQMPLGRAYLADRRRAGKLAEPHELAAALAKERLAKASQGNRENAKRQAGRAAGGAGEGGGAFAKALAGRLEAVMGETAPLAAAAAVRPRELRTWRGAKVLGVWLPAEADGQLGVAAWLLIPRAAAGAEGAGRRGPAVLGICRAGKARMLAERAKEVTRLLEAGIAVCLMDARGCGETSAGDSRLPDSTSGELAFRLWGLRDSLIGRQLRDVRTALAFLAARDDVDPARLGLWGEGLAQATGRAGEAVLFDEVPFRQTSPVPMHPSEPAGGMLAMLAALWPVERPAGAGGGHAAATGENASDVPSTSAVGRDDASRAGTRPAAGADPRVRAVLVRGTLVSWMSVLQRRHHYVPADAVVPGLLAVADMPLIAEALRGAGIALCAEDLRDGSNRMVTGEQVRREWGAAAPAGYSERCTDAGVESLIRALTAGRRP